MKSLKFLWQKWLKIARIIGNFQIQVIFSLFYLILLFPVGLAIGFFSDPLNMQKKNIGKKSSNFTPWMHPQETLEEARRQF